jgi:KaiC/GvpD/RAD55 family RecA-like ATPase
MGSRWLTFEKLVCELGAIRAFTEEAQEYPELAADPEVERVRVSMAEATGAISRTVGDFSEHLDDDEDRLIVDAWTALARAQSAVAQARQIVEMARDARRRSSELRAEAKSQRAFIHQLTRASEDDPGNGSGES